MLIPTFFRPVLSMGFYNGAGERHHLHTLAWLELSLLHLTGKDIQHNNGNRGLEIRRWETNDWTRTWITTQAFLLSSFRNRTWRSRSRRREEGIARIAGQSVTRARRRTEDEEHTTGLERVGEKENYVGEREIYSGLVWFNSLLLFARSSMERLHVACLLVVIH